MTWDVLDLTDVREDALTLRVFREVFGSHRFRVTERPGCICPYETFAPGESFDEFLKRFPQHAYVECHPITGRTHQIRVHLAAIGCPIAGDRVYGRRQATLPLERHFLHAARLTFRLPSGDVRTFEAPLPADLERALSLLEAG